MDDDRINQEKHNCKSEKKGIKLFVLSLVILIFLPITAFAVLDWFASSDALAIGITGYIQTVIVNGVLGLLAVIIALIISKTDAMRAPIRNTFLLPCMRHTQNLTAPPLFTIWLKNV